MIRKITENDKDIFLKMAADFYDSDAVCYHPPKENFEKTFEELMRSDEYVEGFIFEVDENVAGFAIVSKVYSQKAGGIVAWIDDLMVLPEYRSQGLSSAFFQYVEENVPAACYRLETEPDNDRAVKLYKRMGYEPYAKETWLKEMK